MAQLVYRVTGKSKDAPEARRVSATFRNDKTGRDGAKRFALSLTDTKTFYDVRTRIGGRVVTKSFTRRKDADNYASVIEADKLRGLVVDPRQSRRTVSELAKTWLDSNPTKRADTRATDEYHLRVHIRPALGARAVGSVTPGDVQALVNDLGTRLAPRTVRRAFGVVRAIFAYAVANDYMKRSPCRGIKLPQVEPTTRQMPTVEELSLLAEEIDEAYRAMVCIAVETGLRFSEIIGLRVGQLDTVGGSLESLRRLLGIRKALPYPDHRSRRSLGGRLLYPNLSRLCSRSTWRAKN